MDHRDFLQVERTSIDLTLAMEPSLSMEMALANDPLLSHQSADGWRRVRKSRLCGCDVGKDRR
jgi:hypothetical protein